MCSRATKYIICEISSSHGGVHEAQNLLGCTAMFLIEECQLKTQQYIPEDSELQVYNLLTMKIIWGSKQDLSAQE
jgi:hypothetical protein